METTLGADDSVDGWAVGASFLNNESSGWELAGMVLKE